MKMNALHQAIERHAQRCRDIAALEKQLKQYQEQHIAMTRHDFGIADGDQANVATFVNAIIRITDLQRRPALGVV
jgi:hypothetical protein